MKENVRTRNKKKKALALLKEHHFREAGNLYSEICKIDPLDAESWFRLGTIHIELNAMKSAEACFRRVIELRPKLAIAYYNLARSLELQAKDKEAIAVYRELLQISPEIGAYYNIGTIYTGQGKLTDALDAFRQAQQIDPDNPRPIAAEAGVYEKLGEYDAAYARILPLLDAGTGSPDIAIVLASLSQHINCRTQAIEMLEKQVSRHDLAENRSVLIPLHLELARLLDVNGEYDKAFSHARAGNDLARTTFDVGAYTKFIESVMNVFTRNFMNNAPRSRESGEHLIFIVGMPRSGTTLIEQILDSHPQVYGCGELPDIELLANRIPDAHGDYHPYPQGLIDLSEETCTKLAQDYLQHVNLLSNGADYVIDKMPQNFHYLGFIALLFPGAKIIHCMRDPLDICLSCYFQNFRFQDTTLGFSTDLRNLGMYYRQYQRLMAHWNAILDVDFLEVSYEALVSEQEKITRQLLEFCGLPWNEQCLKFYESGRSAVTASYNQVRKPMYLKSIQRWKHYEQYLEPLKNALSS